MSVWYAMKKKGSLTCLRKSMPRPSVRQQRVWLFTCLNVRPAENKAGRKASQELLSPLLATSPMAESKWSVTLPRETVRPLLPVKFYEAKLQMAYFGGQTTPTKQLYVPHNGLPNHPSVFTAFLTSLHPLTSHPASLRAPGAPLSSFRLGISVTGSCMLVCWGGMWQLLCEPRWLSDVDINPALYPREGQ